MKKISQEEFNTLTEEQKTLLTTLGIKPENGSQEKPKTKTELNEYACVVETHCKLCGTVDTKVFLMEGVGNILLSKPADISEIEGLKVRTREELTTTCPSCHDILKLMDQESLIALTLRVAKGYNRFRTKE